MEPRANRCYAVKANGLRCNRDVKPNDVVCGYHQDARSQSTVVAATALVMADTMANVEEIMAIRSHGVPEDAVRLQAAKVLFARQMPETSVVEHRVRMDAALIWERLEALVEQRCQPELPEAQAGEFRYEADGRMAIEVQARERKPDVGAVESPTPHAETARPTPTTPGERPSAAAPPGVTFDPFDTFSDGYGDDFAIDWGDE